MSTLEIRGLTADVAGKQILNGVDLAVSSGEVHAVMGPNGAGKSTLSGVLAGHPSYTVTGGTATLDGVDLLALPAWERAKAGLFLAMQYPVEVPGVRLEEMLVESATAAGRDSQAVPATIAAEAANIG
ncbi:MAG TPA: ATP-binding cassette domain-containing protein, partial [Acidimicrobiales bacterium]